MSSMCMVTTIPCDCMPDLIHTLQITCHCTGYLKLTPLLIVIAIACNIIGSNTNTHTTYIQDLMDPIMHVSQWESHQFLQKLTV